MSEWLKKIKYLIADGETKKALDSLLHISEKFSVEIENEIVLIRSRLLQLEKKYHSGTSDGENTERAKIDQSALRLLRRIREKHPSFSLIQKEVSSVEEQKSISKNDVQTPKSNKSSLKDIKDGITIFQQKDLSYKSKEEETKEAYYLKKQIYEELFGEFDDKFDNIEQLRVFRSGILFDDIYSSQKLSRITIQEIEIIRNDAKKYKWYDRSLLVSSLTLSIIKHKFDSKKVNLLIDFLTDFEKQVWQKALVGIYLTLYVHKNRIFRFSELINRLSVLQEIDEVQRGLRIIDTTLVYQTYKNNIYHDDTFNFSFFAENPKNCFLPYYEDNPILVKAIEQSENLDIDITEITDILSRMPLLDSHKYLITNAIAENKIEIEQGNVPEKAVSKLNKALELSFYLRPYQNIISELYHFFNLHKSWTPQNIFERKFTIIETKLKDVVLAEKEKLFLEARSSLINNKFVKAIELSNKYLELVPNDERVMAILGESYLRKEIYHKAEKVFEDLISITGDEDGEFSCKLGDIKLNQSDYQDALSRYEIAYDTNNNNFSAVYGIAYTYYEMGEYNKSLEFAYKLNSDKTDNEKFLTLIGGILVKLDRYDEAYVYTEKAFLLDSESNANINNHLYTANHTENYKTVKALLPKLIKQSNLKKDYYKAILHSTRILKDAKLGNKYLDALDQYVSKLGINRYTIRHYLMQNRIEDAEKLYEKYFSGISNTIDSLEARITIDFKKKDYNSVIKTGLAILEITPENTSIKSALALSFQREKNYEKSIEYIKDVLGNTTDGLESMFIMGQTYLFNNKLEKAEEIFQRIVGVRRNFPTFCNLGHIEFVRGNIIKAKEYYLRSINYEIFLEDVVEKFEEDTEFLVDLGVDMDKYNECKEKVIEAFKAKN